MKIKGRLKKFKIIEKLGLRGKLNFEKEKKFDKI